MYVRNGALGTCLPCKATVQQRLGSRASMVRVVFQKNFLRRRCEGVKGGSPFGLKVDGELTAASSSVGIAYLRSKVALFGKLSSTSRIAYNTEKPLVNGSKLSLFL